MRGYLRGKPSGPRTGLVRAMSGLVVAGALGLVGCESAQQDNHEKWVNQADARYRGLRTGLIYEMARQHFEAGDLENAEGSVEDALQIDPTNPKLLTLAGRIQIERGRLERAYHLFNLALEHDENNAPAYYYQAVVLQRWKRFDDAATRYEKAYSLEADNVGYLIAWAEMRIEAGDKNGAIALLQDKLDYFEQSAGLRTSLGQLYLVAGRPDDSIRMLEQASVLAPDQPRIREDLAVAHASAGRFGKAIKLLEELLREPAHEGRPDLTRALANAYAAADQKDRAKELYLKLARQMGQPDAWMTLAEMAYEEGDEAGTLYAARRAIETDPSAHRAYVLSGLVWQSRGKLDEALRMFDLAAAQARGDAVPLILRGIALQKAGKPTAAAEAYRRALERQPGDARATRLLQSVAAAPS